MLGIPERTEKQAEQESDSQSPPQEMLRTLLQQSFVLCAQGWEVPRLQSSALGRGDKRKGVVSLRHAAPSRLPCHQRAVWQCGVRRGWCAGLDERAPIRKSPALNTRSSVIVWRGLGVSWLEEVYYLGRALRFQKDSYSFK